MDSPRVQQLLSAPPSLPPRRSIANCPRSSEKCARCRRMRVKCEPVARVWPGQKCRRCDKHGQPCGPNLSRREETRIRAQTAQTNTTPTSGSISMSSSYSGTDESRESANADDRMEDGDSESPSEAASSTEQSGANYFKAFGRNNLGDNASKWLALHPSLLSLQSILEAVLMPTTRLLKLGYLLMFLAYVTGTGGCPSGQASMSTPFLNVVNVAIKEITAELEWTIPRVAKLAEAAAARGDIAQADRIFGRLLDAASSSDLSVRVRRSTLSKIVSFYQKIDDEPQLQKALRILLPLSGSCNHDSKINPGKRLAQSFLTSSRLMSITLARAVPNIGASGLLVNSPALHQSILCESREVFKFVLDDITETLARRRSIGKDHGVQTPGVVSEDDHLDPNKDMEGRDVLGRTALFLACEACDEDKSDNLILAGAEVNERDYRGHTILEMAAGKGLLRTVQSLKRRHADLNPTVVRHASTPLQAAAEHGHLDVVKFLLVEGAKVEVERFDRKNAVQLAQEGHHYDIVCELLQWCKGKQQERMINGGRAQEEQPQIQPVLDGTHSFLAVEDPQGFDLDYLDQDTEFSSTRHTCGDFFSSGLPQDLHSFDPHLPAIGPSFPTTETDLR